MTTTILITGNTYKHRDALKAMGGRWNAAEKSWRVPADKAAEAQVLVGGVKETASAIITVGGIDIAVEFLRGTRPLAVAQWPIGADDIERLSREKFEASGCRADRADICWAVNQAGLVHSISSTMFRAVPTADETREIRRVVRDEADDGLCRPRRRHVR